MPILPDSVVYTKLSDPPGINVLLCKDVITSPMLKLTSASAFWVAPLSNPLSHNALLPVGSSSTSSLTSDGRRTYSQKVTWVVKVGYDSSFTHSDPSIAQKQARFHRVVSLSYLFLMACKHFEPIQGYSHVYQISLELLRIDMIISTTGYPTRVTCSEMSASLYMPYLFHFISNLSKPDVEVCMKKSALRNKLEILKQQAIHMYFTSKSMMTLCHHMY